MIWLLTFLISTAYAIPLWTFTPIGSTSVRILPGDIQYIQYQVTNQSIKTHTLAYQAIPGVNQITTSANNCKTPFVLGYQQYCVLNLQVVGSQIQSNITSGPVVCEQNGPGLQCYQPSAPNQLNIQLLTTLAISPTTTSSTPFGLAASGNPRQMTVTNTGRVSAVGLSLTNNLPAGTSIINDLCTGITLQPGSSCTFNIKPGAIVSSNSSGDLCTTGVTPTPGTVIASATNSSQTVAAIAASTAYAVILNYGCIYQGGYIYAINDNQGCAQGGTCTGGIGGKVVTTTDQPSNPATIIWSSNGTQGNSNSSLDLIPLITETSSPTSSYDAAKTYFNTTYANTSTYPFPPQSAFAFCAGALDGQCNSNNILAFYKTYETNYHQSTDNNLSPGPTNTTYYAAGLCKATISGYSDWYLPAICEMGYTTGAIYNAGCGTKSNPTLQNIQSNLIATNIITISYPNDYWSSTESLLSAPNPASGAWSQQFSAADNFVAQYPVGKGNITSRVRCSRALTS